jgi:large subunit ribosomal protein L5
MNEMQSSYASRLRARYYKEVRPKLKDVLELKNIMEVPRISKITLNIGVKKSVGDSKMFQLVSKALGEIAGQLPLRTKAKTSIANFKIREGMYVGVCVTLRRDNMFRFLEKLIELSLHKVRDFQGVSCTAFDQQGNYNLGIKEWGIFPEADDFTESFGMNITIHTTAQNSEQGYALLKELGIPFKKR